MMCLSCQQGPKTSQTMLMSTTGVAIVDLFNTFLQLVSLVEFIHSCSSKLAAREG
jgi:hypothetical protein